LKLNSKSKIKLLSQPIFGGETYKLEGGLYEKDIKKAEFSGKWNGQVFQKNIISKEIEKESKKENEEKEIERYKFFGILLKKALLMDTSVFIPLPQVFFKLLSKINDDYPNDSWWNNVVGDSIPQLKFQIASYDENFLRSVEISEKNEFADLEIENSTPEQIEIQLLKSKLIFGDNEQGFSRKKRLDAIIKGFSFGMTPSFFNKTIANLLTLNEFISLFVGKEEILGSHLLMQLDFRDRSWSHHDEEKENVCKWFKDLFEKEFNAQELQDFLQWTTSLMRIPIEGLQIGVMRSDRFLAHTCMKTLEVMSYKDVSQHQIPCQEQEFKQMLKSIVDGNDWRNFGYV